MDRQMLLEHLALAECHVAYGDIRLEQQRARLEERRRDGHKDKEAERLLQLMELVQDASVEHLRKIREALAEGGVELAALRQRGHA